MMTFESLMQFKGKFNYWYSRNYNLKSGRLAYLISVISQYVILEVAMCGQTHDLKAILRFINC